MKIAVTADLHLTSHKDHPERFHALENILQQMLGEGIDSIVIAGDLFDVETRNYAEFESLCRGKDYRHIQFHIVPGNHDTGIDKKVIAAENVTIYSEPELKHFDLMSLPILFLPCWKDKTMGELIASYASELTLQKWILVGHGDWVEGMRESNPLEPGVFMPLTRADVEQFQPAQVLLGHIHKPTDTSTIHYAGSPCPLNITETGKRRFLIIDIESGAITSKTMNTDFVFFDETLIVYPIEDEEQHVRDLIKAMIEEWGLSEEDKKKVRLRLKVNGYTADKTRFRNVLLDSLAGVPFYKDEEPDITEVSQSEDIERAEITKRVSEKIANLDWPDTEQEPRKDQILLEALRVIYGEK
ncbi:MAG: metallophosphoesterase [bacterium]